VVQTVGVGGVRNESKKKIIASLDPDSNRGYFGNLDQLQPNALPTRPSRAEIRCG
jgi:hypothetical protein